MHIITCSALAILLAFALACPSAKDTYSSSLSRAGFVSSLSRAGCVSLSESYSTNPNSIAIASSSDDKPSPSNKELSRRSYSVLLDAVLLEPPYKERAAVDAVATEC